MSNQEVLLDAAEALVREEGIEAVTLRAVASRAHYGKSTVHEAFGSTAGLVHALQQRAANQLFDILNEPANPGNEFTSRGRDLARRTAVWAIEQPEWARLAVQPLPRDDDPERRHPLSAQFFDSQREAISALDSDVQQAVERGASQMMLAAMELVWGVADPDFGAQVLEECYTTMLALVKLVSQTGPALSSPVATPQVEVTEPEVAQANGATAGAR